MPIGGPMITWCEPMERGDMKLAPGDVADALAWFKETTGQAAKLIVLNPKNERYAKEAGDAKIEYLGGCLRWEVWLSAEDGTFVTLNQATERKIRRNKTITSIIGRPPNDLPMEKVMELAARGLGTRVIAKRLKAEGINVSHMKVSRTIKKLQGELPIGGGCR